MFSILCYLLNGCAYAVGWLVMIVVTLKVGLGPDRLQEIRNDFYAKLLQFGLKGRLKGALHGTKTELFSSMSSLKSVDLKSAKKSSLQVLEIGVGCGVNFEFYPAGCKLTCVDPNKSFEVYFRRECQQKAAHLDPEIRFITERGEAMPSVGDESVDAVVTTKVLCSVTHLDQMFREIRRVLKPGGKFYFLEHVAQPAGTWRRRVQNVLSDSGLWPAIFDGCTINLEFEQLLAASGFSSLDYRTLLVIAGQVKPATTPLQGLGIVNPYAYGVATK